MRSAEGKIVDLWNSFRALIDEHRGSVESEYVTALLVSGLIVALLILALWASRWSEGDRRGEARQSTRSNPAGRRTDETRASSQEEWTAKASARFEEWRRKNAPGGVRRGGGAAAGRAEPPHRRYNRLEEAALVLLGLKHGASAEDINRAWRREAQKYHPDRNPRGASRMRAINNARDVLLRAQRRRSV